MLMGKYQDFAPVRGKNMTWEEGWNNYEFYGKNIHTP